MKKISLVSCPLLICFAAALAVSAAPPSTVAKSHEKVSEAMYADQDKCAAESRKLASEGKYEEAIKLLQENVIVPLQEENSRIESWKAKARLREFTAELVKIQRKFGKIRMNDAYNAYGKGLYREAISAANDAVRICEEFRSDADELIAAAQNRQKVSERVNAIDAEKQDPGLKQREQKINVLLRSARTLIKNKKFEDANRKVEEVYMLNPFNAEAAQLAAEIYRNYYNYGRLRSVADTEGMMANEAWQWVEPVFPRDAKKEEKLDTIAKGGDDYGLQAKLDRILIRLDLEDADLPYALERIQRQSKQNDPDKVGIDISLSLSDNKPAAEENRANQENVDDAAKTENADAPADSAKEKSARSTAEEDVKLVTLHANNISVREALDYVSFLTDIPYEVLENRVKFGGSDSLQVRRYDVSAGAAGLISGGGDDAPAAKEEPSDGEGDEEGKKGSKSSAVQVESITQDKLKSFFEIYGISFPKGSSISYRRGKITMKNSPDNHRALANLLQELNEDKPMVQIEVKSIELTETDMEELGFNWALGTVSKGYDQYGIGNSNRGWRAGPLNTVTAGKVPIDVNGTTYYQGVYTAAPNQTTYNAESGAAGLLSMLGNSINNIDTRAINNLNLFPNLLGSFKPFNSDVQLSLSLTINALDNSDRAEQISAPKVLVASGEKASVVMGKRYYFPEDWDELEIEVEEDENVTNVTITRPTPSFGESELIGTVFSVTPKVLDDNRTIELKINPKVTSYVGKDEYDITLLWYDRIVSNGTAEWVLDQGQSERYTIWRPVIATRSLDVHVNVYHGETLVLGGLSDSIANSRLDKIPILGDLPLIGRLFQSHSENSTRRTMLIFVTAKLIGSDGVPVRKLDANGGIPDMGR